MPSSGSCTTAFDRSDPVSDSPRFRVLGQVAIVIAETAVPVPARLDRAVLVHLILAEGRAVSVDALIEAVWEKRPPAQARNALQVKVSRLRSLLGERRHVLTYTQGSYRLAVEPDDVDACVFTSAVRTAGTLMERQEYDAARATLERAMPLWRGDPLSELDDHPRVVAARLHLVEEWMVAHELDAALSLATSAVLTEPMAHLRRVLELDPLRPRSRVLLMQALERVGRRADALAVYDAGRRLLVEQTGLSPPPVLQDAFESLLAAERISSNRSAARPGVRAPRARPASVTCRACAARSSAG